MCNCITTFNAQMAPHNGGLVTTMFGKPERCCVEVYPLKTGRGVKKPPKALASFCPFCGEEYVRPEPAMSDASGATSHTLQSGKDA